MSPIEWKRLAEPFPADELEWRVGRSGVKNGRPWATVLVYVTARAIQDRLDEVFGPGNWKNEYRDTPGGGALCRIWFKNDDGEWVWREDGTGALDAHGGLSGSDAQKGTYSNALKRAGSALGIGRYLYGLDEGFAEIADDGRFRGEAKDPADPKKRVYFRYNPPPLPAWAVPKRLTSAEREHLAMIDFLREAGKNAPANVREQVRAAWDGIKANRGEAATFCGLVEEATGAKFSFNTNVR